MAILCGRCMVFYDPAEGCPICGSSGVQAEPEKQTEPAKPVKKKVKRVKKISVAKRLAEYEASLLHIRSLLNKLIKEVRHGN